MKWWDDLDVKALGSPKWRAIQVLIVTGAVLLLLAIASTDWYAVFTGTPPAVY